jgi:predicted transcriptional regulator
MAKAASTLKQVFQQQPTGLTLVELNKLTGLKPSEISMGLCYLIRMRWLSREQIKNENKRGRRSVYVYTFHPDRLPKPTEPINEQ